MKNISLVGFGRIGRDLFRQTIKDDSINIVSVSDIAEKENLVYLLKYDSIYGPLNAEILETDNGISVNGKETIFNKWKNSDESDWKSINTDIVVLATGKQQTLEECKNHLKKGAKKIIIASTPSEKNAIEIYVPGANDDDIDFSKSIISLGSNTANACGPILKILNDAVQIERAFINTVHGYSNSNRLADVAGEGLTNNRAAGENIIPYQTQQKIGISAGYDPQMIADKALTLANAPMSPAMLQKSKFDIPNVPPKPMMAWDVNNPNQSQLYLLQRLARDKAQREEADRRANALYMGAGGATVPPIRAPLPIPNTNLPHGYTDYIGFGGAKPPIIAANPDAVAAAYAQWVNQGRSNYNINRPSVLDLSNAYNYSNIRR